MAAVGHRAARVVCRPGRTIMTWLRCPRPRSPAPEAGSAAAETALVLPAVVLLLACLLGCGTAVTAQVRCLDAARSAARLAARGESGVTVRAAAVAAAPAGSRISVAAGQSTVRVVVSATVRLPLPGRPGVDVSASATAPREVAP